MSGHSTERRARSILAYPMHGSRKMLREGYRTRDAHIIEWLGRAGAPSGQVRVYSRPEPRLLQSRRPGPSSEDQVRAGVAHIETLTWRLPRLRDRRWWWVDSAPQYRTDEYVEDPENSAVIWNPFVSVSSVAEPLFRSGRRTVADLLDDWTKHYAFQPIAAHVERAYGRLFEHASHVTANSEGTLELAHRFGRSDAVLLPNGVDPERFTSASRAEGPFTVGYVGKIGRRLDRRLIEKAIDENPEVRFVFAGPVLDAGYQSLMASRANLEWLGDVHYDQVPQLLEEFDLGWVPHETGALEVGGDIIKTYEYRAAGLPVLSTPVIGAGSRGLSEVHVVPSGGHSEWIARRAARGRLDRVPAVIPDDMTWRHKASAIASLLQVGMRAE